MSYLWILISVCLVQGEARVLRQKRSVLDLAVIVGELTGRNPLDFSAYGCYCGLGGSGRPVDDIDRCCQVHDGCYGTIGLSTYFAEYRYHVKNGNVFCDAGDIRTCACDANAARCFARNMNKFNQAYTFYNKGANC